MSFLSRTLTSAFADAAELFTAVENTKLMWTQRQRQMAKDALKAAGWQFHLQNDLVDELSDGVRLFDCRTPRRGSEHRRNTSEWCQLYTSERRTGHL